ncbi:MAG: glycine/betaine/sarcosine/D-proline family reductase selenoprotein B [Chloroflexi bacterium]|nr:glycine/betaine/sarcosine/D-proline family reductase selenoprotein B [Chloroflexota bacterium]
MAKTHILHYINQFFAGKGGEDKADLPVGSSKGVLGPGKRLQELLGDSAEIVATAYCGDNHFAGHRDEVLATIAELARSAGAHILVAGPAFGSGRYGFACVEVCHMAATSLDLDCITGMHGENPAISLYKQYRDRRVFALPTTESTAGMGDALSRIAQFVSKLAAGPVIGPAGDEGYIPRGIRVDAVASKSGVERAIGMLLDKLAGRSFATEIPVESLEAIPVAPRITNLKRSTLALMSTSGVVPAGNPDGFKLHKNTHWRKYPIAKLDSMKDARWDVIHGGYNTTFMQDNPNFGVPLDVCREAQREGMFANLYPYCYVTPGSAGIFQDMETIGKQIALDMKAERIDGVILVST